MLDRTKQQLEQIARNSSEGMYGVAVQSAAQDYSRVPVGIPTHLKFINDFYTSVNIPDQVLLQTANCYCQNFIAIYREAKDKDANVAQAFANSLVEDYPGVDESRLLPRWSSLAQSCHAFKSVSRMNDPLLSWQQSTKMMQTYNEFLNGLLGFMIVAWRVSQGKSFNINVFNNAYGSKLNEFSDLTGGDDGAFYIFTRVAQPKLRNAIAHESIWLDNDTNQVRYSEGKDIKIEAQVDLMEFMAFAGAGSYLCPAYLIAMSAIVVMEEGSEFQRNQLPNDILQVFKHRMK